MLPVRLKNEFTEDEKYHNLMRWLIWKHSLIWALASCTFVVAQLTYDSYNQLLLLFVDPDQQGVVHDKVTGQKLGIVVDCQS